MEFASEYVRVAEDPAFWYRARVYDCRDHAGKQYFGSEQRHRKWTVHSAVLYQRQCTAAVRLAVPHVLFGGASGSGAEDPAVDGTFDDVELSVGREEYESIFAEAKQSADLYHFDQKLFAHQFKLGTGNFYRDHPMMDSQGEIKWVIGACPIT